MRREFLLLAITALATALPQNEINKGTNNGTMDSMKKYAPRFKHPSKLFNMDMKQAGLSIRLKCAFDGNPKPNITWFKNDGPIERSYFPPAYGKWWMHLDELSKVDNGNYTCLVCNELGCISHTVNLIVIERLYSKPVMTLGPKNQTLLVGETATFSCELLSEMHPYIYWVFFKTYEEYEMPRNSNIPNPLLTSDDPADKPERLTIRNITQEDQGWYICVAVNSLGTTRGEGYLTVLKPSPTYDKVPVSNTLTTIIDTLLFTFIAKT